MTDRDRLGPPPVEAMSDVAWSRVERGLWSRLDAAGPKTAPVQPRSSRRWWLVAAPLAAAAAAAVIVLVTLPRAPLDTDEPARVVSGTAPSAVSYGDSHIELDAHTALAMTRESGHPTVLLERGAAWFTVAPRARRPEFVVRAGDATVRVVGTRFRVARSEERISVEVERGLVNVQFRGREIEVGPDRSWSSVNPAQISALTDWPPAAEPVITEPVDDPLIELPAPAPAPKHTTRPTRRDAKPDPKTDPRTEPRTKVDGDLDPRPATAQAGEDQERTEYERLAGLEPTRPELALAGYMALARGTSRWADLALFAAARLAADRHDRRAETLLGIYLQRFPNGANAADAKQLLARLKADHP